MLCIEHAIESAISFVHNGWSYEDWYAEQKDWNLKNVKSDPKEIWQIANYVYYSGCWTHWTQPALYTTEEIIDILTTLSLCEEYDYKAVKDIAKTFKEKAMINNEL